MTAYESISGKNPAGYSIEVDDKVQRFRLRKQERRGYVFFPLIPAYRTLCLRFGVLGHAFKIYGFEPVMMYDDLSLPVGTGTTIQAENERAKREIHRYRAKKYCEKFGLKSVSVSTALDNDYQQPAKTIESEQIEPYTYRGIDISGYAAASTRKYLKRYSLDLTNQDTRTTYERFLRSGMILADAVCEVIDRYDPDYTIVNEPCYIQGGVPLELCQAAGTKVYTQKRGYHEGEMLFGRSTNRHPMGQYADERLTTKAVETDLTDKEREHIQKIMEKRESGDITEVQYTPEDGNSMDTQRKKMVGVFSHLLWDGALEPDQAIYGNLYDWLDDTIRVGAEMDDVQFVIKIHPAESFRGTNESVLDWLDENHHPLPDNFVVLQPDTNVNTYALIRKLDAGIVYASTVGLEMAFNGVPVITGGFPPYHGFGLTYDPSSQAEFRKKIREIDDLKCHNQMKLRAERFAHFLFECKHLKFPYISNKNGSNSGVIVEHDKIAREKGPYSEIVNQAIDGEEILSPNCMNLKDQL
ncbi:hypothetical protein HZS55_05720 [Halosimplex rubrum]|uniref:Capsule polysaccharide biosynthesis protein n=1 Tax=Halosimplex rubrum TaxID=869889 RepID=A0A7D5TKQ3_9EURY|nr:hypothetical protein HZS55_05720 [Halosimplex rubrum]